MLVEILLATILVSLVSLVGISLLLLSKKTMESFVFIILSFATGTLFGAAFLDLLPEAIEGIDSRTAFMTTLGGILIFFILERIVHWHHEHHEHPKSEKPLGLLVLFGDGVHNFFDGVAIAASFLAGPELGITTTFAIIMHEIPQELSDFTLLIYAGLSTKKALAYNFLTALTAIVGALAFLYFSTAIENIEFYGLALAAGTFIYIAGTDLLPELHRNEKRTKAGVQLASMLAGIALIWFLTTYLKG